MKKYISVVVLFVLPILSFVYGWVAIKALTAKHIFVLQPEIISSSPAPTSYLWLGLMSLVLCVSCGILFYATIHSMTHSRGE